MFEETAVAIVGAGHLGSLHARALHRLRPGQPCWIVDTVAAKAEALAREVGARAGTDLAPALAQARAVVVATPTESHCAVATAALRAGCDVLVEKPMTSSVAEGRELLQTATELGRKLQVGHIERFNPIFRALRGQIGVPAFVEAERLATFVPRSLDIDVVLDLMVHDLDLLLSLVPEKLVSVDAVGVAVLTGREDIANARLRFANGTVANLTASRVSQEKVRKIRFFSSSGYLSLDLLQRSGRRVSIRPGSTGAVEVPGIGRFGVEEETLTGETSDPLTEQLRAFIEAVEKDRPVEVSGAEALRVLRVAEEIHGRVRESLEELAGAHSKSGTASSASGVTSPGTER
jgi:predicted dehydrogenase